MSDRPRSDDDELDAAYARSHALADEGREPSAAVRANVLAAARDVAAQAKARAADGATPPLAPAAPPIAAVGRGRTLAVNLSSWRVRSGAAICAALLVALGAWRLDAGHRVDNGVQVASASLELAAPPTRALPKDLPPPPLAAALAPYPPPPPVVDDPVDRTPAANAAPAKATARDRQVIVAEADQAERAPPTSEARIDAVPAAPGAPAPQAPSALAPAPAPAQAPTRTAGTRIAAAAAAAAPPTQFTTLPPMAPSVVPRRVPVVPSAEPASKERNILATATPPQQRLDVAAAGGRRADAADGAPLSLDAARQAGPTPGDSAEPRQRMTLQSAADRGDVEALQALLAEPAVRVDAPDAAGRTALLHAVLAQQMAAVRLLLAAGAEPGRADHAGLTPRAAAQAGANAEIAGLLAAPH